MTIPKIFFTYWEGNQLSFMHYFTIYSFIKYNPDEKVIIYTSEKQSNKFINWTTDEHSIEINKTVSLNDIININPEKIILKKINFELQYSIDNNISVVHKADFIRITKLYEHGGMWFDFDILFIRKIPDILFENKSFYYFIYADTIPTGLLLSEPKTKYLLKLLNEAKQILLHEINNYQTIGPDLWNKFIYTDSEYLYNSECLDNSIIYPYDWLNYKYLYATNNDLIKDNTIGIHWYNGGTYTKEFINLFNSQYNGKIDKNRCVIEKYLYGIKSNN